jgi:hypothetical protein
MISAVNAINMQLQAEILSSSFLRDELLYPSGVPSVNCWSLSVEKTHLSSSSGWLKVIGFFVNHR